MEGGFEMEHYKIENLKFTYPMADSPAISDINLNIPSGQFVCICGKSGCGKTTLLRLLKSSLSPHGAKEGSVYFCGTKIDNVKTEDEAAKIGFVMQNTDNQIVCDKVWHELSFGLENLGLPTAEIRSRVCEIASFFGINNWFDKNVNELSGGQKQILNLASVTVMHPDVIILDEPTAQLDPIAAEDFLKMIEKLNRETGITIIMSEHRLNCVFSIADRIIVMDEGKIISDATPYETGKILKEKKNSMFLSLPAPMYIYGCVDGKNQYPVTIREGRAWLESFAAENPLCDISPEDTSSDLSSDICIKMRDVHFRYEKNSPDVICGLNLDIYKGEIFSLLGGNASGKSTLLSLIAGINKPYRGKVNISERKHSDIENLYGNILCLLPQNPQSIFIKKTVFSDLCDAIDDNISEDIKIQKIEHISDICHISHLLCSHPYDLSGGEQQRAALCKLLLKDPDILLLDEPTKGLDAYHKNILANILSSLKESGKTFVIVSHDTEFCAAVSDRCGMLFDGMISSVATPRSFFSHNTFYTTPSSVMSRNILKKAIYPEDIIKACGKKTDISFPPTPHKKHSIPTTQTETKEKKDPFNIISGTVFSMLFLILSILQYTDIIRINNLIFSAISVTTILLALYYFSPGTDFSISTQPLIPTKKNNLRTVLTFIITLIIIPLTVLFGVYVLKERKFYFISLMIIFEMFIPFIIGFESRMPKSREIVIISVLCAIAVCSRTAFFMLPQFKPVIAIIIVCGICLGGEYGFIIGSVTGFVSNFFFGQGPWTPWQMFSFGIIGFLAGILFRYGVIRKKRLSLCIFGFLSTLIIYGFIMNLQSVIAIQNTPTLKMILSAIYLGLPFDLIHASSTAIFLWFLSVPISEKIDRIRTKYGIIH